MRRNNDGSITLTQAESRILLAVLLKMRKVFDKIACYLAPDIKSSDLEAIDALHYELKNLVYFRGKKHE